MSTNEPATPTPEWETRYTAIEDEDEAREAAKQAVLEPLTEAHARAKRVLDLEKARAEPRPTLIAHAQWSQGILEQATGMWRH